MVATDFAEKQATALVKSRPLVAVFVGGTNGIGEATVRQLARYHGASGPGLRVYIVGRSSEAANKIIAGCQRDCPKGQFRFVKANDLTLLRDVDEVSKKLTEVEKEGGLNGPPRIDLLYLSQGFVRFDDPLFTPEGLEVSMSLLFYSRIRFIHNLMPLLLAAERPAHVISIFNAGHESRGKPQLDNLALTKNPKQNKGLIKIGVNVAYMKTMYFEYLAQKYPGKLSLTHIYPGLVIVPNFKHPSFPTWFKILFAILEPIAKMTVNTPVEVCAARMLYLATSRYPAKGEKVEDSQINVATSTDGVKAGGAYSCYLDTEINDSAKYYVELRKQGFKDKVVQHIQQVFAAVDEGRKFVEP